MADDRPTLLPQPKTVTAREGAFTLDADTQILLLPDASDALVRAARSLQGEIEAITGLRVPLVRTARPARAENVLLLAEDPAAAAAYLPGAPWPVDSLAEHGEQAYWVSVTPSQILAGGRGDEAAHYAAQTLRQLVRGEGARLPALEILDWPSLAYRGVMMDVSRGKVHTMATLKRVVDELSLFKMNVLQLYTEHTFVFPHHPRIGAGCGSLSGDDMMALDAYARDRFVELQPNLNSFGHMAHLLAIPEYRHLAEAEIGNAPVHYCWVALGSQGRLESGMQSDQDNALLISDEVTPEQLEWFGELARRVVEGLVRCGFPLCTGDMMASNPQWRVPLRTWGGYFAQWMNAPEPEALLNAQTFFDMRPVHGDRTLYERLQTSVIARAPQATRFLAYLAKQAQRFEPPLGLFRDFVTSDETGGKIDLKSGGIAPIVQIARLAALSKGGAQLNTIDRLRAASSTNALSEEKAADLTDAFEFISYVRLQHQVKQMKKGQQADNLIDPASLSSFERRHLKEAFAIIRKTQGTLAYLYRTDVTS